MQKHTHMQTPSQHIYCTCTNRLHNTCTRPSPICALADSARVRVCACARARAHTHTHTHVCFCCLSKENPSGFPPPPYVLLPLKGLASKKRAFPLSPPPIDTLCSISRHSPYITAERVLIWPRRRDRGESVGSFLMLPLALLLLMRLLNHGDTRVVTYEPGESQMRDNKAFHLFTPLKRYESTLSVFVRVHARVG